jgi:hypothetical protein
MIGRRGFLSALFGTGISLGSAKALANVKTPAPEAEASKVQHRFRRCDLCIAEGQKSKLYIEDGTTFLDDRKPPEAYWDEEGLHHYHAANARIDVYHCSRGHRFSITEYDECTGCGFMHKILILPSLDAQKSAS